MMTKHKRGKDLAREMREQERSRPAAQWCSVCEEWTSWTHKHAESESGDQSEQGGR